MKLAALCHHQTMLIPDDAKFVFAAFMRHVFKQGDGLCQQSCRRVESLWLRPLSAHDRRMYKYPGGRSQE